VLIRRLFCRFQRAPVIWFNSENIFKYYRITRKTNNESRDKTTNRSIIVSDECAENALLLLNLLKSLRVDVYTLFVLLEEGTTRKKTRQYANKSTGCFCAHGLGNAVAKCSSAFLSRATTTSEMQNSDFSYTSSRKPFSCR